MSTPPQPSTPERKPTPDGGSAPTGRSGPAPTAPASGGNRWLWPLLALVIGVGIGLLVMGLVRAGSGTSTAAPTVTSTTTVTSTPSGAASAGTATGIATATVPAECLLVADDSQKLVNLANQAVQAARDLNASQLSDLVRQIGEAQQTLTTHADTCRAARATVTTAPPVSPSTTAPPVSPSTTAGSGASTTGTP